MEQKLQLYGAKACSELIKCESHVYYNVNIANTTAQPLEAKFNEVRGEGIVDIPEDYNLAIIRFSVPGQLIPIFFMPIQDFPNLNPNLSTFSVTLSFGGVDFQTFLIYTPHNTEPVPNPPTALNPHWPMAAYYGIFSYQHLLDMINTAYATSFAALKVMFPAAPPTAAPYFTYDSTTELVTLWAQQLYDPVVAGGPTIEIFMDDELYSYFESFDVFFFGFDTPAGKDYQFLIKNNNNNIPAAPVAYYTFPQQYATLYNWNALRNIVFLTGNIPVKAEYIPITNNFGTQVTNNYLPILTDFQASPGGASAFRGYITFFNQGEYRRVDLKGKEPLKIFDIQVYWADQLGNLHLLFIPPFDSISIKMLFEHKGSKKYL